MAGNGVLRSAIPPRSFAIIHSFPQIFGNCFLRVQLVCLFLPQVPCAEVLLLEVWLRHRTFPHFLRNFPAIFRNWS